MIKKFLLISIIILSCFFCCGSKKNKPVIVFNVDPINTKTVYNAQSVFKPGQTIHYVIFMPKGFKEEYVKMQVIRRGDNGPMGGLTVAYATDIYVEKDKKFYIDEFVLHQPGTYIVRFIYFTKLNKAFAENAVWVQE